MSTIEIEIIPSIEDNGNGIPTTKLEVTVDLSSIMNYLKKYDLLVKTVLEVQAFNPETQKVEDDIYEYAQIYRDIEEPFIQFETFVLGEVVEASAIKGKAEGVFVKK